jgi:hypothetical protein
LCQSRILIARMKFEFVPGYPLNGNEKQRISMTLRDGRIRALRINSAYISRQLICCAIVQVKRMRGVRRNCLGCQLRTPTESTINSKSQRSDANALPWRHLCPARGPRGGGVTGAVSGAGRGTPGWSGASSPPPPERSPGIPNRPGPGDGRPAQDFSGDPRKTENPGT